MSLAVRHRTLDMVKRVAGFTTTTAGEVSFAQPTESQKRFLLSKAERQPLCSASNLSGRQTRRFCSEERSVTSFHVQDEEDFRERVLQADRPVVVQFHADWCGPCKMLGPRLESMVDGRGGRVLLAKVNIDNLSEIAIDYGVESVPTVYGVKNGEVTDTFVGDQEDVLIEAFLDRLIQ